MSKIFKPDIFFQPGRDPNRQKCGYIFVKGVKSPSIYSRPGAEMYLRMQDRVFSFDEFEIKAVRDAIENSRLTARLPKYEENWLRQVQEEIQERLFKEYTWEEFKRDILSEEEDNELGEEYIEEEGCY
ncbi:MAG: hypothetical protein ABH830_04860 [Patescibacteria group bacterium]